MHPNGGYYTIDVEGIVLAHEHGLVFTKTDIDRLIATNRDFMRNGHIRGAKFRRIDGGEILQNTLTDRQCTRAECVQLDGVVCRSAACEGKSRSGEQSL